MQGSPQNIYSADLDSDGKADVVTTSDGSNAMTVLRNTSTAGNVSFGQRLDFTGKQNIFMPKDIMITDLDGDGKPDIVVSQVYGASGANLYYYRNHSTPGQLAFSGRSLRFVINTYNPSAIAIADMDRDGRTWSFQPSATATW